MTRFLFKDPHSDAPEFDDRGKLIGNRLDIARAEDYWSRKPVRGDRVFRIVSVQFMNEYLSQGATATRIYVLDADGRQMVARAACAWPRSKAPNWEESPVYAVAAPGKPAEFPQGAGNYSSVRDGALGPYVYWLESDGQAAPILSDVAVGAGLDSNRHVYHMITFQECTAYVEDVYGEQGAPVEQPGAPSAPSGCVPVAAAVLSAVRSFRKK